MSAYITLYIKRTKDNYYIELDSWSRSSKMFHYLSDLVSYESCREVNMDTLDVAIEIAKGDKAKCVKTRDRQVEGMNFCNSISVATAEALHELIEQREYYKNSIEEFNSEIEEIENAISQLVTYCSIAENISNEWRSKPIANLYLAYEMDPNNQDENEEKEN